MASRNSRVLTDHDEIRRWAEERNANPACVRGTGGNNDIGVLRLDFPGYSGADSLEHIDWKEWFGKFDERGLALLVQDRTARGERSNFNKLVSRETAAAARSGRSRSSSRTSRSASTARRTAARSRAVAKPRTPAKKKSAGKKRTTRKSTSATRRAGTSRSTRATAARSTARRAAAAKKTSSKRTAASTRRNSTARRKTSTRAQSTRRATQSRRNNVRSIESGRRSSSSNVLTDHDEIRRWAEERNAAPSCVRGTGGGNDPGMIRLDFPGFSGARSLQHIDWNEWFRAFDENNLALLVQNTRSGGGRSNFNKLIAREGTARRTRSGENSSRGRQNKAATSRTRGSAGNRSTKKETRGSTRARRTESVRGRTTSQRRAA